MVDRTKDHEVDENPREALTPVDPLTRQKYYGSSNEQLKQALEELEFCIECARGVGSIDGFTIADYEWLSAARLAVSNALTPVETKAEPQVGDEIVLNFTSSLVKSRTGWKIDRIDRTEYFFVSDSNGSVLTLLRGQFACSSVELRVLCICPPGVSRIDCPACGNDAHRLSPPPPDPIVGENEDMGSAAPPPLKASGEYQTYPGEPITGIYEAGIAIVRLGKDDEATGE